MKKLPLLLLTFSLLTLLLWPSLGSSTTTFAQTTDDLSKQLQDKQTEIQSLENSLHETQNQEKTLKSQLDLIDGQTKVTTLKIEETNLKIEKLKREIDDLSSRIDRIGTTLDSLSELLLKRIVQTYKYDNSISTLDLLLSSHGFADLIERLKYIQVAQSYDKKKLYELQATKLAYNDQKQDKQARQNEAEKLSKDLEVYQAQLTQQKKEKDELLRVTQNNEAIYQQKLQAAVSEQNAILSILSGGGSEVSVGPVHKGDTVGHVIIGASACSSGTHLHFEVHQSGALVNPAGLLSNHSIVWDDQFDSQISFSGSWDWPIIDPIYIEQPFGNTWYAQHGWYSNPPGHTGVDMYTPSTSDVRTIHDGTLSSGSISCGGGTLRYKKVDHGDGTSSYYFHVI